MSTKEKGDTFATMFIHKYPIDDHLYFFLKSPPSQKQVSSQFNSFDNNVKKQLKILDTEKVIGSDNISVILKSHTSEVACLWPSRSSFNIGIYPTMWKFIPRNPSFTKGSESNVTNHYPHNLRSISSKRTEAL